jgi:ABC-type transport system substrate-binding protein
MLSIIKGYWAKIGVDLKIDVRDFTVYSTMGSRMTFTQMYVMTSYGDPFSMDDIRAAGSQNRSVIRDPEVEKLYPAIQANYFDKAKVVELYTKPTETRPNWATYANEQAWFITLPCPDAYVLWQPWLKGYGAWYGPVFMQAHKYPEFVWIDQELKKAMGR